MATTGDPNSIASDGIKNAADIKKAMEDMASSMSNTTGVLGVLGTEFGKLGAKAIEMYAGAKGSIKGFEDAAKAAITMSENFVKAIKNTGTSFESVGRVGGVAMDQMQAPLDKLIVSMTKLLGFTNFKPVIGGLDNLGSTISTTDVDLGGLIKTMDSLGGGGGNKLLEMFGKMSEETLKAAQNLINNAVQSEKLQNAFIGLSAAGGDMNSLFKDAGGTTLVDLSAKLANYTNVIGSAADATGLSVGKTGEFANAIKAIPGALDQSIGSMNTLVGSIRLMSGTGTSQKQVIDALATAYEDLGQATGMVKNSAEQGAAFLADVSSVANTLGLRFDDVDKIMTKVADTFKFVGDNSDAAANILGRYTQALRETGLTGKASMEIVDGMVESLSKMTIGTKAFLSLRSGGPGGLQGAFQIDQLMRQGKLDEVAKMAERSIRQQFGGRIYTQAEAASSPQAAEQFMRQRSLLQSGAFGIGKNANDEQATRLLEALGKGNFGDVKGLLTGTAAVKEATDRGSAIQQSSDNSLKMLTRQTDKLVVSSELQSGIMLKQAFGQANYGVRPGEGKIGEYETNATNLSTEAQGRSGTSVEPADFAKEIAFLGRQTVSQLADASETTVKGAGEIMNQAGTGLFDSAQDVMDIIKATTKLPDETDRSLQAPSRVTSSSDVGNTGPQSILASNTLSPSEASLMQVRARRQGVYNAAVQGTDIDHRGAPTAARGVSRGGSSTVHHEMKPVPPQKIILQITAPPGFGIKNNTTGNNNIEVMNGAAAGINTGGR